MRILDLPTEILYDILGHVTPSWRWGWRWKDRRQRMLAREDLIWFLNLRLVNKRFDDLVISHVHAAIRAKQLHRDLAIRRGPATASTIAMARRLLRALVDCDRAESSYSLVNTIIGGVDGAVGFFAGGGSNRDSEALRTIYANGMIAVYVGVLGTDMMLSILENSLGADLDNLKKHEWRHAALMAAAYLGRMEDMKQLNAPGLDLNSDPENNKWLYPPLMAAALGGQEEVVRFLIDQGADPNLRTFGNEENAVHFAALGGHASLVRFFLDLGVEADAKNGDGDTPLLWAAGGGHADVAQILLTKGADINIEDRLGRAPLIWATTRGYDDVVRVLLHSKEVDVNTADGDAEVIEVTPLAVAAVMGRENIFQMLFAHPGVDREVSTVFHRSLIGGRVSLVKTIIDAIPGTLEEYEDGYGETALLCAAGQGSEELVRFLLTRDEIFADYQDFDGYTALHRAIESGKIGKVNALLEHPDLDVNLLTSEDHLMECPLTFATSVTPLDLEIVKALLAHPKINVNARDLFGRTPLAVAALRGRIEMVRLLLARDDVDKYPKDEKQNTVLHLAVESQKESVVASLFELPGTYLPARNTDGLTALALAAELGQWKVVDILLSSNRGESKDLLILDAIASGKNKLHLIRKEPHRVSAFRNERVVQRHAEKLEQTMGQLMKYMDNKTDESHSLLPL